MQGTVAEDQRRRLADARIDRWLWLQLRSEDVVMSIASFWGDSIRRLPANSRGANRVNRLLREFVERRILSISELEWITADERQNNWLCEYIKNRFSTDIEPIPPGLTGKDLVVAGIDLFDVELEEKHVAVMQMHRDWNDHLQSDSIFKWFKDKDEAVRCEFAWDWLVKHKKTETRGKAPISNLRGLLMFFDAIQVSDAQKKLDVAAIKRKWSQQKYREGMKGKSQYNFMLSDQVISNLDKLATRFEASRPQIIEALIEMETIQGNYLVQKIKKTSFN